MTSAEKFSLKWNSFQENISTAFNNLRDDTTFTDVTLISEDGQQLQVHKVILSASSPFFMNIFKINKHPNPLLYLKGFKGHQLHSIIDFMYHGVAEIYQENLDGFLAVADELQLKGLTEGHEEQKEEYLTEKQGHIPQKPRLTKHTVINNPTQMEKFETELYHDQENDPKPSTTMLTTISQPPQVSFNGGSAEDLKAVVWSMISQSGTLLTCTVCGKTKDKSQDRQATCHMASHVESLHVDGATYDCTRCEKTFRSKQAIHHHTYKAHKHIADLN